MLQILLLPMLLGVISAQTRKPPHIIFIMADDMGWNDVSFHGSDEIPTPNIDALAYDGVMLKQHYVQAICTPSRSAFMTGKYPIHTGMQGDPITAAEPRGLPPMKILPQYLKELGYSTHAVGKWHLGYHRYQFNPLNRGFDSFFGYYTGFVGYYDHIMQVPGDVGMLSGYDMRRNWSTAWDVSGRYATDVFSDEAVRLIQQHNASKPMFLYLAHLAVHAGNGATLLEAPQSVVNQFQSISDPNRRVYAAMVSKLDESVGRVVDALQKNNMLQNSVIVFTSDNGAPTIGMYPNWGSNQPLRGVKWTVWEGGVRSAALAWSPLFQYTPRVCDKLMHLTDWLPTFIRAAGGNPKKLVSSLDGVDQWDMLVSGAASARTELLVNIDEKSMNSAYRIGDWKLVVGTSHGGTYDNYYGSTGREDAHPPVTAQVVRNSTVSKTLQKIRSRVFPEDDRQMILMRSQLTVNCDNTAPDCFPKDGGQFCLYNVVQDPCETTNRAAEYPHIVEVLLDRIGKYRGELVPQLNLPPDNLRANPRRWNNTWTPWVDCLADNRPGVCNSSQL